MEYMNTKELVIQLSTEMSKSDVAYVLGLSRQRVQLILGTATGERQAADLYRDLVQSGAWEKLNEIRAWIPTHSVSVALIQAINELHRQMAEYHEIESPVISMGTASTDQAVKP